MHSLYNNNTIILLLFIIFVLSIKRCIFENTGHNEIKEHHLEKSVAIEDASAPHSRPHCHESREWTGVDQYFRGTKTHIGQSYQHLGSQQRR